MAVNVNFYRSTDTGATLLDGVAGSLITVLDSVLINGYNSKTITITRSGATATASCTAHGFNDLQTILISGANETDYNGTFRITNVTANTFDFTVANSPATPATGTITAKVNPAGWTKPYSGTNKAVYRSGTGSNQRYYRIEDNTTPSANHSYLVGYGNMTDVDTGTDRFPTTLQFASGLIIWKSTAASGTTRDWIILATSKICYLWTDPGTASGALTGTDCPVFVMGDYVSTVPGDTWNSVVRGNSSQGSSTNTFGNSGQQHLYSARDWSGVGTAKLLYQQFWGSSLGASGGTIQYPCPISGDIHMTQMKLLSLAANGQYHIVGYLPGLWFTGIASSSGPADGDTWTGTSGPLGDLSGKTFIKYTQYSNQAIVFEISDTW